MLFWFLSVLWSSANLRRPHSNSPSEHYMVEMILVSIVSSKLGTVNLPTSPAIIPWSTRVIFKCFVVRYKIVTQLIEDVQAERWELISERIAALLNLCKEPMFIRYLVGKKTTKKNKLRIGANTRFFSCLSLFNNKYEALVNSPFSDLCIKINYCQITYHPRQVKTPPTIK